MESNRVHMLMTSSIRGKVTTPTSHVIWQGKVYIHYYKVDYFGMEENRDHKHHESDFDHSASNLASI